MEERDLREQFSSEIPGSDEDECYEILCLACGAMNAEDAVNCSECGEPLPDDVEWVEDEMEEEERGSDLHAPPLEHDKIETGRRILGYSSGPGNKFIPIYDSDGGISVMQKDGIEGVADIRKKIPLEKAGNLIKLKEAVESIEKGKINIEQYKEDVAEVLNVAQAGVTVFGSEIVRNEIAGLPQEQATLAQKTAKLFQDCYDGCLKMLEYDGGRNLEKAYQGMKMVEDALIEMDRLQDRALDIAQEELEEAARNEAAAAAAAERVEG